MLTVVGAQVGLGSGLLQSADTCRRPQAECVPGPLVLLLGGQGRGCPGASPAVGTSSLSRVTRVHEGPDIRPLCLSCVSGEQLAPPESWAPPISVLRVAP